MKAQSELKPKDFKISKFNNRSAEVLFTDNVISTENGFEYDLYALTLPYRENLESAIRANPEVWLEYAKQRQNEVVYTSEQLMQQEITELQLENIEQGQLITDLELIILEG